jgi:hypothetical protein
MVALSGPTSKTTRLFATDRSAKTDVASREITARETEAREEKSALLKALRIERLRPTGPQRLGS